VTLAVKVKIAIMLRDLSYMKKYFSSHPKSRMIIIVLAVLLLLYTLVLLYAGFIYDGSADIRNTAQTITRDAPNDEMKVKEILNWERQNIDGIYGKNFWTVLPRFPFIAGVFLTYRMFYPGNPSWIMFTKYGTCIDFAVLFSEMATAVGIENRVVVCPGEDHAWVEVNISGSWKNADATISNEIVYDDAEFYERNWSQMSRVYYIDPATNEKIDITNRYTDIGELVVNVDEKSSSLKNVVVIVKSMYKCGNEQTPKEVIKANPDSNGTCVFNLGGNNYTVTAYGDIFAGQLIGLKDEKIVRLEENSIEEVILRPSELTLLKNGRRLIIIVFLCSFSIAGYVIGTKIEKYIHK